mmetsp:Transcript_6336/g.26604  ORF Transcript_6336/g.26604 Transcript_6336/m.26604 type:complete len:212 (+) Transcript_6336:1254-1889(+)
MGPPPAGTASADGRCAAAGSGTACSARAKAGPASLARFAAGGFVAASPAGPPAAVLVAALCVASWRIVSWIFAWSLRRRSSSSSRSRCACFERNFSISSAIMRSWASCAFAVVASLAAATTTPGAEAGCEEGGGGGGPADGAGGAATGAAADTGGGGGGGAPPVLLLPAEADVPGVVFTTGLRGSCAATKARILVRSACSSAGAKARVDRT